MATDIVARLRSALEHEGESSSDFDLNPDTVLPEGRKLRSAGVLIAVSVFGDRPEILLTKRSSVLKHHPGQIAFPGGKQEESDTDVTAAALREASEEVGLPVDVPRVIGHMPAHECELNHPGTAAHSRKAAARASASAAIPRSGRPTR